MLWRIVKHLRFYVIYILESKTVSVSRMLADMRFLGQGYRIVLNSELWEQPVSAFLTLTPWVSVAKGHMTPAREVSCYRRGPLSFGLSSDEYQPASPFLRTGNTVSIFQACLLHAKSLQLCLTLCDPMNCSLPGSFVHGILQSRILERVAMPSSRDLSKPGIEPESFTSLAFTG